MASASLGAGLEIFRQGLRLGGGLRLVELGQCLLPVGGLGGVGDSFVEGDEAFERFADPGFQVNREGSLGVAEALVG